MKQQNMIYTIVRDNLFGEDDIMTLESIYGTFFDTIILHDNGRDFERTKNLINTYRNRRELLIINGTEGLDTEDADCILELSRYIPIVLVVPDYRWVPKNIGAVCNFDVTEDVWGQMNSNLSSYFESNIELRDINNRKLSELIETKYENTERYLTYETDWDDLF